MGVRRIAALAVAPTLAEADILRALRCSIDPVFLPRRLRRITPLPRNETGKLPPGALLRLLDGDAACPGSIRRRADLATPCSRAAPHSSRAAAWGPAPAQGLFCMNFIIMFIVVRTARWTASIL